MAFPFIAEANFENGLYNATLTSTTDTQGKLSIAHTAALVRDSRISNAAPYRGAYCMKVDLAKGTVTTTAYYQDDTSFDIGATGTTYGRFYLYLSTDLLMADTNEFHILVAQSTGPVSEMVIGINYTTADGLRLAVGQAGGTSFLPIEKGKWNCVEYKWVGAAGSGTIDYWLNGSAGAQVASLTNAAVIQGRLGSQAQDAGTTKGVLLIDQLITDDARIYPLTKRFPSDMLLTKSGHVFIGHGIIENVTLMSGAATDNVVSIFDTDTGNILDADKVVVELKNVTASDMVDPAGMPCQLQRGCYVSMTGTTPRALVKIGWAPAYGSDGAARSYAVNRKHVVGETAV